MGCANRPSEGTVVSHRFCDRRGCAVAKQLNKFSERLPRPDVTGIFFAVVLVRFGKKRTMKNEQAPSGAIPPVIQHVCALPAKPQPTIRPTAPKPAAVPPKPEPTLEQKVADEVERRLKNRIGNVVLGFLLGEFLGSPWDKHHQK